MLHFHSLGAFVSVAGHKIAFRAYPDSLVIVLALIIFRIESITAEASPTLLAFKLLLDVAILI